MTYDRYSVFPAHRSRGIAIISDDAISPISVYMDESGNGNYDQPLIVGAVVVDNSVNDTEAEIRTLYNALSARSALLGHEGFEKFRKDGFHACSDPIEVSQPFLELIQRGVGFKTYLICSTARSRNNSIEKQAIAEMYESIISDNMIRYSGHLQLSVYIEENHDLRSMTHNLQVDATRKAIAKAGRLTDLPRLKVEMTKKGTVMTLGIIDYVMMAASRWIRSGFSTDPKDRGCREIREVAPSISYFRLLESDMTLSRKVPLP